MTRTEAPLDVLVAGYGPTGATLAALLGRRGWRVAVVDAAAAIYDKPRAITADHEALRIFQEIGIADEVAAASVPHPGTDYLGLEGQVIKRFYPAPPPELLGWTPSFMFVQPELEATLRRAVERLPAVQAGLSQALVDFEQDDDGVTARLRGADGHVSTVRARHLVGADGASSTVRRQLAPAIEDLAFDEWWLVVDAWVTGPVDLPPRCAQFCRPSRPGTYIVGPGKLRRWEIKMLPVETPQQFQDHDAVWSVLGEFVDTRALAHCRTAVYRFHALVVETWRCGRVFLAGDAAHQMPPFLGQGLCAGVRDACNLAWKLDAVMRGDAADTLLDTYGEERKRHVRTVVGHAKDFGLIIGELDVDAARERDRRLGAELASGRAVTIRQRFIPGLETGLLATGAPGAGELFPQPWVREPGAAWRRLDDVLGPRFAIVAMGAMDMPPIAHWQRLGGRCVAFGPGGLEERDGLLAGWMATQGAVAALVRPDRYVYGLARCAGDMNRLVGMLCDALDPTRTTPARRPA